MRGLQYALLAGAALFAGTSAQAATTITFVGGAGGLSAGQTLYADFNSGPSSFGAISGSNYIVKTGSDGTGADPAVGGQGDPYLSVNPTSAASGIATFSFASQPGGGVSQLGLDYGSADTYNSFILHLSSGPDEIYTGQQVIGIGIANGNQTANSTNGRLTFTTDPGVFITSIDFTSTQAAGEYDNLGVIAAVPEPSTWGLMLFGFGAIGMSLRRRRRSLPGLAQAV